MLSRPDLGKLGEELHSLLVGGDETAPSRIAETFLPVILTCLRYDCQAAVDDHLIMTAAHDALLPGSGVKRAVQGRRGLNLATLASIFSARFSIIGEGRSLSTGRFCGRVSSAGIRNSL
jgi:hypothetical protein